MRIGILGVGGIGGVIGGHLARADRDVTLIDMWLANVDYIQANGVTVTTQEGEFNLLPPGTSSSNVANSCELPHSHHVFDVVSNFG